LSKAQRFWRCAWLIVRETVPLPLGFAKAWQEYRRAETRLPAKPPPVSPRRIAGATAIADRFDLFVLDAWGVLNIGNVPIASATTAVAGLRALGKRLLVLSNDGTRTAAESALRHRARGFDFADDEVVVGVDLLPQELARLAPDVPIGLIADAPRPLGPLTATMVPLADDAGVYDAVAAFVFLSSDAWSVSRQALLLASLRRQPRPLIIGNPDIVSPEPTGMAAEPGYWAHHIAAATGIQPVFCGKPFASIYRHVAARFPDIPPERVLCVGDTLHTDILGGRAAGFRTLLIEDGFCRDQDGEALAADSGIWPDFIAPRL
jgi:glycerol 3-phosphatase-2